MALPLKMLRRVAEGAMLSMNVQLTKVTLEDLMSAAPPAQVESAHGKEGGAAPLKVTPEMAIGSGRATRESIRFDGPGTSVVLDG